jgi:hypothetical protein
MTKFVSMEKQDCLVSYFGSFGFDSFLVKPRKEIKSKFEDPRCFEAWKRTKRYQGAKILLFI